MGKLKLLQFLLKVISKRVLSKYNPQVIGITGSVGKTSARDAIRTVLSQKYTVRANLANYNNEIGLPLTILGLKSPNSSIFGWFSVFLKSLKMILVRDANYPEILVLEMGVDRPGDLGYLVNIAKPHAGVLTMVGHSHAEYFGSIQEIRKEKALLLDGIEEKGWAVANFDNEHCLEILKTVKANAISYGLNDGADVRATDLVFRFENEEDVNNLRGLSYQLNYKGKKTHISLPDVLGYPSVYASLAASAVALTYGFSPEEIAKGLEKMQSPKGRMNLVHGVNSSMIIDDTYNASPQSSLMSLDVFSKVPVKSPGRKILAFGDMLELGVYSQEEHLNLGELIQGKGVDFLVTVGERANDVGVGAKRNGYSENKIKHFSDSVSAGKFLKEMVGVEDLILAKGSRGTKMDLLVKEIMKNPEQAGDLLVGSYD